MLSTPKYAGEPSVEALASGLATLGRYGDDYMVHAAHGETVIPKEVFDNNPQLKQDLFRQMMMMGIEDPNRYVVGNSLNSINPVTGQPEFFFKKVFKAIKKVFKKALPVIAPVVGNLIAPGIGGIIASGLVTKLQGGSWGDVLKSAAMSYAGSALMSGIGGAYNAPTGQGFSGFTSGLSRGLTAPFTAASNLFSSGPLNPLQQGIAAPLFGSNKALAVANPGMFGKATPRYNPDALAGTGLGGLNPAGSVGTATGAAGQTQISTGAAGVVQPSPVSSFMDPADLGSDYGAIAQDTAKLTNFEPLVKVSGNETVFARVPGGGVRAFSPSQADALRQVGALQTDSSGSNIIDMGKMNASNAFRGAPVPEPGIAAGDPGEFSSLGQDVVDQGQQYQGQQYIVTDPTAPPGSGADSMDRSFFDRFINPSKEAARLNRMESFNAAYESKVKTAMEQGFSIPNKEAYWKDWSPKNPEAGFLRRIAPIGIAGAAGAVGIGALTGAFDFEEEEQEFRNKNLNAASEEMKAYDEWKKISDKNSSRAQALYFKWHGQPKRTRSQFEYLTGGRSSRPDWMFLPENFQEYRAMGGEVIGPGTGTSDSIPARLSDGEFVMTADAVRNAGGGDRNLGAARMYDMMRRFEGGTA